MGKINKLINRIVRRDSDTNKSKVYAVIVICFLVCGIGFFGFYYLDLFDIDGYLQNSKDIINLYDFYDEKVGVNETSVFFIGSSLMGCSVYPPEINKILKNNGYDINAYDLFIEDDTPIRRSLEIQKIIDSKPSLVIYGITYRSITAESSGIFSEKTRLVYHRLNLREDSYYLYTNDELKKVTTEPSLRYKKAFLISALKFKIFGKNKNAYSLNYNIDPYGDTFRIYYSVTKNYPEIVEQSNDPNDPWRPIVTNESTRYKDALIYNVKTLQDAGIPVIIINMPIHPLFSEKITDESRQNFFDLLNQTGAVWYDMERNYGDEFFRDSHHATFYGAHQFAPVMADLIIEQVKKGVIHYS